MPSGFDELAGNAPACPPHLSPLLRRFLGLALGVVEGLDGHAGDRAGVEAARVHADAIGVGARHVEGFHPADRAEILLRHMRVEGVGGEVVLALLELELRRRHDQVEVGDHAADRAVAIEHAQMRRCAHAEAHPAAMTTAPVSHHRLNHLPNPPHLSRRA